ncbi:hypothetical protein ATJ88_2783 [Isoptericola jiangsuensis]|uniref:Glycosyltransferase involved in cell wall biosynthesis n=1 Tax=Isoptericola jiangsuensis TaxID=548579 RepID=A0A2A9F0R5_9MICO|nr:DUF6716 putative glycosyltransferase [Isoptericola jiangsuensis]PFG44065.1 hypothetical protein ATJ88_2783 [Isoptericola jiangsuensis]
MSGPSVLAVADSDSYLKWAAWTLARLRSGAGARGTAVVVRSPLAPTPEQARSAVTGTGVAPPAVLGPAALARRVRDERPDVLLVAATGPVAELVARAVVRAGGDRRPALVTGLPGMALPATVHGTGWRRWADAFVVHAPGEVAPYRSAFAGHDRRPALPVTRLPFLDAATPLPGTVRSGTVRSGTTTAAGSRPVPPHRVVVAAQAKVPATRAERLGLLDGLARLADDGFEVVVKLRARGGERQTHNEPYPLDVLWAAEAAARGHRADAVTFAVGPMADHLGPGTALLTVSSTAALESLARGLPTVFLDDFGVGPEQLNVPFAASGCLVGLADVAAVLRSGGPVPDPQWCAAGYLHDRDELGAVVTDLAAAARAGALPPLGPVRPFSRPRHGWSRVRSALPVAVSARLTR